MRKSTSPSCNWDTSCGITLRLESPAFLNRQQMLVTRLSSVTSHPFYYDSGQPFDPPKCYPNTRVAVLKNVMDWILGRGESPELGAGHISRDQREGATLAWPTSLGEEQSVPARWVLSRIDGPMSIFTASIPKSCFVQHVIGYKSTFQGYFPHTKISVFSSTLLLLALPKPIAQSHEILG